MPSTLFPCRHIALTDFEVMPFRFVNAIDIKVPPEQVFTSFEAAEDWPLWAGVIQKVTWTSPKPFGLGTTRTVEMSGGMTGYEEFVAWEPGKRMAFRFNETTIKGVEAFGEDYQVEEIPSGCRVTWTMVQHPVGVNRLVMTLARPLMNMMFRRYLKKLKELLEVRHPS